VVPVVIISIVSHLLILAATMAITTITIPIPVKTTISPRTKAAMDRIAMVAVMRVAEMAVTITVGVMDMETVVVAEDTIAILVVATAEVNARKLFFSLFPLFFFTLAKEAPESFRYEAVDLVASFSFFYSL